MLSNQYIAGFFDGEGCVYIGLHHKGRGYHFCVSISQKKPEILYLIKNIFGGKVDEKGSGRRGICYQWRATKRELIKKFFDAVEPFCIVKANDIKIGREFLKTYKPCDSGYKPLSNEERSRRNGPIQYLRVGRFSGKEHPIEINLGQ